jgi:hypothetical protein
MTPLTRGTFDKRCFSERGESFPFHHDLAAGSRTAMAIDFGALHHHAFDDRLSSNTKGTLTAVRSSLIGILSP